MMGVERVMPAIALLDRLADINRAHAEAKKLYLDRLAPDFRVFDFIEPDEMRLSKILAWLLDPRGTHGQGGKFLRLLFDAIEVKSETDECNRAKIQTELSIDNGRLDIVVNMVNFRLIIENKPWAVDQQRQIQRYFEHLEQNDRSDYAIIYLTPKGTTPSIISISDEERKLRITNKQLHIWAYETKVIDWLTQCRIECRSDRVSMFIDEISSYIRVAFAGIRDKTMDDHLLDEITSSADRVSAAMQVVIMGEKIKQKLLSSLRDDIASILSGHTIDIKFNPNERFSGIKISYSNNCPYNFELEFQNTQFNVLYFGVSRLAEHNPLPGNEYNSLVAKFGRATQNASWLWVRPASPTDSLLQLQRDWQISPEPWIEIANRTLARKIVNAFTETLQVLKSCGSA
jgi:hypothetical protein